MNSLVHTESLVLGAAALQALCQLGLWQRKLDSPVDTWLGKEPSLLEPLPYVRQSNLKSETSAGKRSQIT